MAREQAASGRTAREAIEGCAFFQPLPPEARAALAARLVPLEVPSGALVVRTGEEADRCYLVADGRLEVWSLRGSASDTGEAARAEMNWPPPGQASLLAVLAPGDLFGEMALLLGGRRTATVRAATEARLYALDAQVFRQVVAQHPGFALALEEEMALRAVAASLGRASSFARLPPEALRWLAVRCQRVRYAAGAEIIRQGEPGDAFYLVRSGQVEVVAQQRDGSERRLALLGPGEPFGEQALLTGDPRTASVRAVSEVEALRLSREDFRRVLRQHRAVGTYFSQLVLQRQRPRRIEHWALEWQEGAGGERVAILKDTRTQRYVRLSERGMFLWELMDGQHTVRDLAVAYFQRYRVFGLDTVLDVMLQLHAAGFVHIQRLEAGRVSPLQRVMLALLPWLVRYLALPDVDPLVTALYRRALRPLFTPVGQGLLLAATLAGAAIFGQRLAVGESLWEETSLGGLTLAMLVGYLLQVVGHELAHAVTCRHFGREVHRAGVGWYLFLPVAFVDTSDIWLAGKGPRVAVALAGPYTNFILSGLASLLLPLVGDAGWRAVLLNVAASGYLLGLVNLNPLIEFDGYYALMDVLEVPNLRAKALAFLGSLLGNSGSTVRDPRLRRLFVIYGLLSLNYTLFVAYTVLTSYHGYVEGVVSQALPPALAGALGWALAGGLTWLIVHRAWHELRGGMRARARPARLTSPAGSH